MPLMLLVRGDRIGLVLGSVSDRWAVYGAFNNVYPSNSSTNGQPVHANKWSRQQIE